MSQEIKYEPQFTMMSLCGNSQEVVHTFHIDWMYDPSDISFESTFIDVMNAISLVQQNLLDYYGGPGIATIATFFRAHYRTDIIEKYPVIKDLGWNEEMLAESCISWLAFWIKKIPGTRDDYLISVGYLPQEYVWQECSESTYEQLYERDCIW